MSYILVDVSIGSCMLSLDEVRNHTKIALEPKGTITLSCVSMDVEVAAGLADVVVPAGFTYKIANHNCGTLLYCAIRDAKVRNAELLGVSDPYVKIECIKDKDILPGTQLEGSVKNNTLTPVFNVSILNVTYRLVVSYITSYIGGVRSSGT